VNCHESLKNSSSQWPASRLSKVIMTPMHEEESLPASTGDDLSALAWVHEELRRSLDAAHKSLRRVLKDSESTASSDTDSVDPALIRAARTQLHQGVGALELVGLPSVAMVLRASEALVQRYLTRPHKLTLRMVEDIERASFALLDYLTRTLAGKSVPALALFPQYRVLQEAAGSDRVHPADLWSVDWKWRDLPSEEAVTPCQPSGETREALEAQLLGLMRAKNPLPVAAEMSNICASLGAGAQQPQVSTLWKLAAAVFEAQAHGLLGFDVFSKRVASRLLAQHRALERGEAADLSERLAQDLLFFCAQSASAAESSQLPRLTAVQQVYALAAQHRPVDYGVSALGRFDPALIAQAQKRVAAAKEAWSAVAGGEKHRLAGLAEQFGLVGESLKRLFPLGEILATELLQAVAQAQRANVAPPAPMAMEMATSLLYLEAALEDADFDHPEQAPRVKRLAERLGAVRQGAAPEPLDAWMEELYRRVSDRQTMGGVVQELRASLSEAEQLIDQFFRNPAQREVLCAVPNQISAMRGVLSVLGMDHASQALLRMRDDIDGLISTEVDPVKVHQSGLFDRLAGNLGALGFLIDMLAVQPQMAKSLFSYNADTGVLAPVMGPSAARSLQVLDTVDARLIDQVQMLALASVREDISVEEVARDLELLSQEAHALAQPELAATVLKAQVALRDADNPEGLAAARGELSEALVDFVATATEPVGLEELAVEESYRVSAPMTLSFADAGADLADDQEMREIFLEEAREVLVSARASHVDLLRSSSNLDGLTTLRRAFHTLKGSSRMLGLREFGEAAWTGEQLYNSHLADQSGASPALLDFTDWALVRLSRWVDAIEQSSPPENTAQEFVNEAKRVALGQAPAGQAVAFDIDLPIEELPEMQLLPPDLPSAADLDLDLGIGLADTGTSSSTPQLVEVLDSGLVEFVNPIEHLVTQPMPLQSTAPELEPVVSLDLLKLDLDLDEVFTPPAEVVFEAQDEPMKVIGPLRISLMLFNIYMAEAEDLSRRLTTEVAQWAMESHRPISDTPIALAHSLAGSSATVGFSGLSKMARALEHAQMRSQAIGQGTTEEARLFVDVAQEVQDLLRPFAEGVLREPCAELLERLAAHELSSAKRLEASTTPPAEAAPFTKAVKKKAALPAAPVDSMPQPQEPAPSFAKSGFTDSRFDPLALNELKPFASVPTEASRAHEPAHAVVEDDNVIDAVDAIDAELFPIFEEEALDLLPQLDTQLREWTRQPTEAALPAACMRTLHTLKGGARLSGAMRLGEMAHRLESRIEQLLAHPPVTVLDVETLQGYCDTLSETFEALRASGGAALVTPAPAVSPRHEQRRVSAAALPAAAFEVLLTTQPNEPGATAATSRPMITSAEPPSELPTVTTAENSPALTSRVRKRGKKSVPAVTPVVSAASTDEQAIDWSRFPVNEATQERKAPERALASQSAVRVRAPLLDRLVNLAGEVSITRSRIDAGVAQIKGTLGDLTDNLERLRAQLRDIEFHGEMQMTSRLEAAKAASQNFDPLEFDRFTRFQELTRMMAESVNDVATVQRTLQRSVETTEDELVAQARMTRDLQDDLLRTRMVEFEGLSDRLYRVVRQAAKETGKTVRLDIVGGSIEVDRGVLDRMTGSFEHLLRNCVSHGIEMPADRTAAGKDSTGTIIVALTQEGNEVGVEFRDDGAGLNLVRIRAKGVALGLIEADAQVSDGELANLIFSAGFSTASSVTELAGRGVGMDVVRSEVNAMGGRVETATAAGQGTSFRLILPLTTAVTQVVMLRCGEAKVAVPSTLVETVLRATHEEINEAYTSGAYKLADRPVQFFWLGALLQLNSRSLEPIERPRSLVVIRSAQQRIVLHVDEVLGNEEVVVKHLGPQLSRMPGLAGVTLLASGAVALIYNPVALATLYGDLARSATALALQKPTQQAAHSLREQAAEALAPLVMVVDDSLTVRRVTQRLLQREGYRVVLAKDGLDALERLAEELPKVVLSDIEMPRMDGFDLVRNMRGDDRLRELPVVMITSRIAQKHRDYAAELGVDHYLGKPYSEEDLLALVASYARAAVEA
jgi:chemosensory pili system protein ChpA (sensor histidine kinase/response regulator)